MCLACDLQNITESVAEMLRDNMVNVALLGAMVARGKKTDDGIVVITPDELRAMVGQSVDVQQQPNGDFVVTLQAAPQNIGKSH